MDLHLPLLAAPPLSTTLVMPHHKRRSQNSVSCVEAKTNKCHDTSTGGQQRENFFQHT